MRRAYFEAGDIDDLARDDARDHDLVPPAPRLSFAEMHAMCFTGRYLWRLGKEHAHRAAQTKTGSVRIHCMTMRDAWVTWSTAKRAQENGGIVR
jgi:hypothetical protein